MTEEAASFAYLSTNHTMLAYLDLIKASTEVI